MERTRSLQKTDTTYRIKYVLMPKNNFSNSNNHIEYFELKKNP